MTPFTAAETAATAENPRAVSGGNRPRLAESLTDACADINERLPVEFEHIKKRTAELIAAFKRCPAVVTKENAGMLSDQIAQIAEHSTAADALRAAAVKPVLAAQRQINGWFDNNCFDELDVAKSTTAAKQVLTARLTIYERAKVAEELRLRQEVERLAREEAARLAREAEEAAAVLETASDLDAAIAAEDLAQAARTVALKALEAATVSTATLSTVRGDFGSSSSLRKNWKGRITDRKALNLNALADYISQDAIDKAINAHARQHEDKKPIAGVLFWDDATAVVRG